MVSVSNFYLSNEWRQLRKRVIATHGYRCLKCGVTKNIEVDHVMARSKCPRLELSESNLQTLCKKHNLEKGVNTVDYRGLRGYLTRGVIKMKYFMGGFITGCIVFYLGQDLTLSYVIAELQYGLSLLQNEVMTELPR